jgi:hypothetical protein
MTPAEAFYPGKRKKFFSVRDCVGVSGWNTSDGKRDSGERRPQVR